MNKNFCVYENIMNNRGCFDKNCGKIHRFKRSDKICPYNEYCREAGNKCFMLHDVHLVNILKKDRLNRDNNSRFKNITVCKYGRNCCELYCSYYHPEGRNTKQCPLNEKCPNALFTCFLLHDLTKITPICRYNKNCINYMCDKRHSKERIPPCPDGSMCYNYISSKSQGCPLLHPKLLQKLCRWDMISECKTYGCAFIHKPTSPKDCPEGINCLYRDVEDKKIQCKNKHPKIYSLY